MIGIDHFKDVNDAYGHAIGDHVLARVTRVTISAGVASRRARESLDALLGRADEALYRAKENGRDRVEHAG